MAVLGTLYRCGPTTSGELAAAEKVKPPSMTRTVGCLEELGLVTRRPHDTDGRQVVVELTDAAREVIEIDRVRRDAWLAQRLDELEPEEPRAASSRRAAARPVGGRVRSTFAALRIRNYRLFATGSLVSNVGTWMQRVAQDWLVLALTGSAGALGLTTGLQFLPIVLFSPFAGVIADRYAKRQVLVVTQLAMGATAALLGVLAITGLVQPWHIYVLAFVFGSAAAFDMPARQAFVNEMVTRDDLPNAIGLNSASFNLARMIGPAAAGVLIAWMGSGVGATGWVILLNARELRRRHRVADRGCAATSWCRPSACPGPRASCATACATSAPARTSCS